MYISLYYFIVLNLIIYMYYYIAQDKKIAISLEK